VKNRLASRGELKSRPHELAESDIEVSSPDETPAGAAARDADDD
jgi:hypothetical protein